MKNLLYSLLILVLFVNCDKEISSKEMISDNEIVYQVEPALANEEMFYNDKASKPKSKQKIIKTSYLSFETESVEKTFAQLKKIIAKNNGYIQNDNTSKEYNQIQRNIVVKIPTSNFQTVIDHISNQVSIFDRKTISLKDVTEEFIDLEARLKAKKALEKRYLQLLDKAKNVKEMLEIEREIATIREEIEAKQGRLKYLKNQVSYSTINLSFYETVAVVPSKSKTYFSKLIQAFKGGFKTLGDFILGLLYIWPFIILLIIALFYIRKRIKNRKNNK